MGSAMSNNHPTHHKEHRAAPETPPTNPGSLFLPLCLGLQLPLLLKLGLGEMLIPLPPKPLNSWQAREMSEKAILYSQPPYGHSSKKEESDKLGPGVLGRVPPERAAARIITKDCVCCGFLLLFFFLGGGVAAYFQSRPFVVCR